MGATDITDINKLLIQMKSILTSAVCSFVAISSTVWRLFLRRGRFGMDDTWAGFAVAVLLAQIAGVFVHIPNPTGQYKIIQIAACYVLATSFYTIVWSSRLSILFSIIRVHPDEQQRRRFRWIAALFIVVPVILICQLFWVCEPEPRWKYMLSPQSPSVRRGAPAPPHGHLLDVHRDHRRLAHTCFVHPDIRGVKVVVSAIMEDCVSLIVCNIPVVVTAAIKIREDARDRKNAITGTTIRFASREKDYYVECRHDGTYR
ncbi:hypothetical protein BDZ89DRAFT_1113149 [Hymenopellis radicata]|nr:hypothetical protein BDZ89DRAFT_1113149 [Hymenopellis radicata]